ncbi:MAG: hypothetical protein ABSF34_21875, partial [Verrucomicrobiota bacterium]
MKPFLLPSIKIPAWQLERASTVHRLCRWLKAHQAKGKPLFWAIRSYCRRWNGKALRCDPSRRLALTPSNLYRLYSLWRKHGERPDALYLKFYPTRCGVPAAVMIRFLNFFAARQFRSFNAAWQAFQNRGGNAGPGRLVIRGDTMRNNLPNGAFKEITKRRQDISRLEQEIALLRMEATAEIIKRVP